MSGFALPTYSQHYVVEVAHPLSNNKCLTFRQSYVQWIRIMKRSFLFGFASVALMFAALPAVYAKSPIRPNIILVLVDDMGWGDLSLNQEEKKGVPRIATPNLRRLADEGAQLRRHYTSAPVCAPARASLFGGVHQGHAEVVRNNSFDAALENSHTLASVLKEAGYATALIGKWGIGGGAESGGTPQTAGAWPTKRGFDYFFGYHNHLAGHRHYPKEERNADPDTHTNAVWDGDENITPSLDSCYSTDLFTARAKKWIIDTRRQSPEKPFFLALTYTAPHARLALPSMPYPSGGGLKGGVQWLGKPGRAINTAGGKWDSYVDARYADKTQWKHYAESIYGKSAAARIAAAQRHATMISRVDDAVGDIVALCRDLKIDKDTFLVFTSDNGPHNEPGSVSPTGDHPALTQDPCFFRSFGSLDGIKRDVWEGGLRVPCLVYAPGLIAKKSVVTYPGQFQDWMATFAELAGVPAPMRSDGVSLLPVLTGRETEQKRGVIYSEYAFGGKMASYPCYAPNKSGRIRGEQQVLAFQAHDGKWLKALRTNIRTGLEDFEIYDVDADSHEAENLAARYPDEQEKLKAAALYNRRAYDYVRDPASGVRRNPCGGARNYDNLLVPANSLSIKDTVQGLRMCRVMTSCPWVPQFDTLPGAAGAESSLVENLPETVLPAGSVTQFKGYINVPQDGNHWHFYLTLDAVEGSKAYIRMHRFQLVDADFNYKPGARADESAASNTVEKVAERTGKRGVPLQAGLHEIEIVAVQGSSAPGKIRLEWNHGPNGGKQTPRRDIPASAYRTDMPAVGM